MEDNNSKKVAEVSDEQLDNVAGGSAGVISTRCPECGEKLWDDGYSIACTLCAYTTRKCPKCGEAVINKVCVHCGHHAE